MVPDKNIGVIVLTNETNVGLPDAIGRWILDRILGNPKVDHVADMLKAAETNFETAAKLFAKPASSTAIPSRSHRWLVSSPIQASARQRWRWKAMGLSWSFKRRARS